MRIRRHQREQARKQALRDIVGPYGRWERHITPEQDERARQALLELLHTLRESTVEKIDPSAPPNIRPGYIFYLLLVHQQLEEGDYVGACNEAEKLIHFQPVLQRNIRDNLVALLARYLEV